MPHTPGPWTLMDGMPTNVVTEGGLRVARCDFDGDFSSPEASANAHLVSAAPDLLAALKAARFQMTNQRYSKPRLGMEKECDMADAAIAKAMGSGSRHEVRQSS